jgi:hypothetical protein
VEGAGEFAAEHRTERVLGVESAVDNPLIAFLGVGTDFGKFGCRRGLDLTENRELRATLQDPRLRPSSSMAAAES